MKFAIYEGYRSTRRVIVEADSAKEAKQNWEMGINCEVDCDYWCDDDDFWLEDIEEIEEGED